MAKHHGSSAALTQVLAQIRQRESTNNYGLSPQQNYNYGARGALHSEANGAYQFQPATWRAYAQAMERAHPELAGVATKYALAYQAPPAVQDAVAAFAALNGPGINSQGLWGASAPPGGYPSVAVADTTPVALATGRPAAATAAQDFPAGVATPSMATVAPGYNVLDPQGEAEMASAMSTLPSTGTLTKADLNATRPMGYAEQRDAFAQRYATIPWMSLQRPEQEALLNKFGFDAPAKYEAMRATLPGYAPPTQVASAAPAAPAPPSIATQPLDTPAEEAYSSHASAPVMPAMKPIPAGPYGSDSILRAELANSPADVAKANDDIRANVINKETYAGAWWKSDKIAKSITDYLKTGVLSDPVLGQAIKANIISNPGLLVDATPAVRADTMKTLNAVPAVTPTGNIPLPSARPAYDGGPSMATTPPPADLAAGFTADTTPARSPDTAAPVSSQGEVPASVTWPSMASASGKDALQAVSDKTPAAVPAASMATSPPPDFTPAAPAQMVGGITIPPVIGSPADVPDVSVGAAPPVTVAAAAPKTIATTPPPPSKAAGGRVYRAIAQPISPSSGSFWSGPMRQPNFTAGSGGATMAYQPFTGPGGTARTTTDVRGDKVNVGVYTDENGTQHQYTWSPSGAP